MHGAADHDRPAKLTFLASEKHVWPHGSSSGLPSGPPRAPSQSGASHTSAPRHGMQISEFLANSSPLAPRPFPAYSAFRSTPPLRKPSNNSPAIPHSCVATSSLMCCHQLSPTRPLAPLARMRRCPIVYNHITATWGAARAGGCAPAWPAGPQGSSRSSSGWCSPPGVRASCGRSPPPP